MWEKNENKQKEAGFGSFFLNNSSIKYKKVKIWNKSENTHLLHCMADLLFDWFGFNQSSKSVSNSTQAKQLKHRRSAVQWNFSLQTDSLVKCDYTYFKLASLTM